jgi:hypothetical protein
MTFVSNAGQSPVPVLLKHIPRPLEKERYTSERDQGYNQPPGEPPRKKEYEKEAGGNGIYLIICSERHAESGNGPAVQLCVNNSEHYQTDHHEISLAAVNVADGEWEEEPKHCAIVTRRNPIMEPGFQPPPNSTKKDRSIEQPPQNIVPRNIQKRKGHE